MRVLRRERVWLPIVWVVGSAVLFFSVGMPTSHDLVFAWLALGMAAFSATEIRRKLPRFVFEWSPFVGILFIYDRLRGIADGLLFRTHELAQIHVEEVLFGTPVPTVWLQQHLWSGPQHLRWWDYATWLIYLTHFVATLAVASVLWLWAHDRFARFATMVCVLALAGFATYVIYPAEPPWLAARQGDLGMANRTVAVVWPHVPLAHYGSLFEKGQHYANNVAAMPSLHAGYALLITLYLWKLVPRWWRVVLALYPPAMAFSLVYAGEHYVVDCLAGWVYATATFVAVNRYFAWRDQRSRVPEAAAAYAD